MHRLSSKKGGTESLGLLILVALFAVFSLVAGCSPKKVIKTNPGAAKTVAMSLDQEEDFLLPLPTPKGKSGVAPGKNAKPSKGSPTSAKSKSVPGNSSAVGLKAAALAKKQLGKQYKWGAEGPDRFDCSGLALFVYKNVGIQLPRNSSVQAKAGKEVTRKELQPGDLLFFALTGKSINHVGIYVGGNKFVHAPKKYNPVRTDSLNNSWWRQRLKSIRRVG